MTLRGRGEGGAVRLRQWRLCVYILLTASFHCPSPSISTGRQRGGSSLVSTKAVVNPYANVVLRLGHKASHSRSKFISPFYTRGLRTHTCPTGASIVALYRKTTEANGAFFSVSTVLWLVNPTGSWVTSRRTEQRPRTKAVQKFFTWGSSRWPVLNSNRAGSTQARPADGAAPSAVCSALGSFPPLVLGSRRSPLALAQAAEATRRLQAVFEHYRTPGAIRVEKLQTTGDARVDVALWQLGGKGLFTKELDRALVEGAVDVCVHSMKDMPTVLPAGTVLAAVLPRQDPRDVLIFNSPSESSGSGAAAAIPAHQEQRRHGNQNEAQRKQQLKLLKHGEAGERNGLNKRNIFDLLPVGAVVGTTSLRRSAQLLSHRPDLRVVNFRGNVQRRISRLLEGSVDATLLALAGLRRLRAVGSFPNSLVIEGDDGSCEEHHDDLYDDGGGRRAAKGFETTPSIQSLDTNKVAFVALDEQDMLPAVAQGAVGLQCRAATNHKDKRVRFHYPLHLH
eukprot:GHVT01096689.1.p1 GENE.GHVT01096689.1~~GHVT01096689.1.p1  ORF type:complete len:507 (+),score=54.78 GHVT01096689.1:285-1805(+)